MLQEFYLIDYKGKFTIIVDELDDFDYEVGRISKEQAIREAEERIKNTQPPLSLRE